mmetsp:Transcript_206/g.433  ORF Transcript_206/g.433 Transcript_206/m.433 type:complete len:163 (-) Transcript_206:892-1380(-)
MNSNTTPIKTLSSTGDLAETMTVTTTTTTTSSSGDEEFDNSMTSSLSLSSSLSDVEEEEEQVHEDGGAIAVDPIVEPHVGYKKVLVTGGAGFIGSHVAQLLLERGDDVVIVDEMNDYYDVTIKEENLRLLTSMYGNDHRLKIYRGDICDSKLMTELFETERP